MTLEDLLIKHEGVMLKPYRDTKGKLTLGVGRNLDDVGISRGEALVLLSNDIDAVTRQCLDAFPEWFPQASYATQAVIVDMVFNMGMTRFKGFQKMIAACTRGDWDEAANQMLQSVWASEVKGRAAEDAQIIRTGIL